MKKLIFLIFLILLPFSCTKSDETCTSAFDCPNKTDACIANKCQNEMVMCNDYSCENGSCIVLSKKPFCECNNGYKLDPKDNHKCILGSCTKKEDCPGDMVCISSQCKDSSALCDDVDCSNHGNCIVKKNKPFCECEEGYIRDDLSCNKDKCYKVSCEDFELCNPSTGECEIYKNPCEDIDCGEFGECEFDENQNTSCKCNTGYHFDLEVQKCVIGEVCVPDTTGESCGDIIDNDCDGKVNEGCTCSSGEESDCYTGPSNTLNVGVCKTGKMSCAGGEAWGSCENEILPTDEICNGLDDDCNGSVDKTIEGEVLKVKCYSGNPSELTANNSRCKEGYKTCTNGNLSNECVGEIKPIEEQCGNSIDDDCDGEVDEDCVAPIVTCSDDIAKVYIFENPVILTATASDSNGQIVSTKWEIIKKPEGTNFTLEPNTGLTTKFTPQGAGEHIIRFSATDNDNETSYCDIKINAESRDHLYVNVSWDNTSDVDLYLLGPNVNNWTVDACNWGNTNPSWYADSKQNPHLDIDDTDGFGPEVIQIQRPNDGHYTVGVQLFDKLNNANTVVKLKIRCQDEDFVFTKTMKNQEEWWFAKDIVWADEQCTIEDASRQ